MHRAKLRHITTMYTDSKIDQYIAAVRLPQAVVRGVAHLHRRVSARQVTGPWNDAIRRGRERPTMERRPVALPTSLHVERAASHGAERQRVERNDVVVLGFRSRDRIARNEMTMRYTTAGRRSKPSHELRKRVLVHYDGVVVGDYEADMLVEDRVLVENKAIRSLTPRDEAQLVNYLTATQLDIGLLLNFGAGRLEFKRKSRTYRAATARQDGQDGQDEQHQGDELTGP